MLLTTILGARPQFVKAASISRALYQSGLYNQDLKEKIIHTGQHYDPLMSDIFFSSLSIQEPAYNLGIGGGSHGENTGRMLESIEKVLLKDRPDAVLVYGDTNSTLAGALAASKLKIPVMHVESGLRSFNREQPEEQNRVLVDHLSEICFCPTPVAETNLVNEGISAHRIHLVGDVMADSVRLFSGSINEIDKSYLDSLPLDTEDPFIICTVHRAENTDCSHNLASILRSIPLLPHPVLFPVHPRTFAKIQEFGLEHLIESTCIVPPLSLQAMFYLLRKSVLVMTDSGGLQKESYLHNVPCVTIRNETEWQELLVSGWNKLADPSCPQSIVNSVNFQLSKASCLKPGDLYGDGHASERIVKVINNFLAG